MFPIATSPESTNRDRAPWTARDTALGVVLTLVPLLAFSFYNNYLAGSAGGTIPKLTPQQDLIAAILQFVITGALEAVFLLAPFYYARKRARPYAGQALGLRGFNPAIGMVLITLSVVGVIAATYAYTAIAAKLHLTVQTNVDPLISELHQAPLVVYASLLVAVLIAPISEEIFFRGFLLQGLRLNMPAWAAILLSSLIFAAAHLSLGSFPILFILAIFLGILRVATRSIWPGVILHTLNNSLTLLYVLLLKH